jgi:hypothetical protein
VRWENLFDDLGSQLEQGLAIEEDALAREDERVRIARLGLRDRLVAMKARPIAVTLRGGSVVTLTVEQVGRDWVVGGGDPAGDVIVPFGAIASVALPLAWSRESLESAPERDVLAARLGLAFVLRDLARRRLYVEIVLTAGVSAGTLDRVGRDHIDVAEHERDEPRRDRVVRRARLIPLEAIECVRLG